MAELVLPETFPCVLCKNYTVLLNYSAITILKQDNNRATNRAKKEKKLLKFIMQRV